jgi:adenine-specific DNA-methyltransferase
MQTKKNIPHNFFETKYSNTTSLMHRKKFAQFFTPPMIADLMAQWILGNENLKTVLEPAFGLGIFSRALLAYNKNLNIKGFDVDPTIFNNANEYFQEYDNVSLILQDYMYNDWRNKYDGIICNPPYFKFHDYDNKNTLKEIEFNLNYKLNGATNLYTLFLLKSIFQLAPNGRCAYIIPSEFLNSDYGKIVKSYLIKSKTLRHIIVVNFEENIFDGVLTTASIILCANDNKTNEVQFTNVKSINDLEKIENLIKIYPHFTPTNQTYMFSDLNPDIKWKTYYQKQNSHKFKNLVPFSTFAKVVRGIATGSNDYFIFNSSKVQFYSIDETYLLPCICKATDVKKPFFTYSDFKELKTNDKNIFLLNASGSTNENVINYLHKGEDEGINKKFLTSHRTPWFAIEHRPPAPIWVSVFNRSGLRFIRNEANLANLTSFHCVYPTTSNLFPNIEIDILFAYLLTPIAREIFEDNCREYGNGLQKFEPNDLNKSFTLNLTLLDEKMKNEILTVFHMYRIKILKNEDATSLLNQLNLLFINFLT